MTPAAMLIALAAFCVSMLFVAISNLLEIFEGPALILKFLPPLIASAVVPMVWISQSKKMTEKMKDILF